MPIVTDQMGLATRRRIESSGAVVIDKSDPDGSAGTLLQHVFSTASSKGKLKKVTVVVVEGFATNDIALDLGYLVSNGTVTADPDAYTATPLALIAADRAYDNLGNPLAAGDFDAVAELDAGYRYEFDFDQEIPPFTEVTMSHPVSAGAGTYVVFVEWEAFEDSPVKV
jgi:hypothetical protein